MTLSAPPASPTFPKLIKVARERLDLSQDKLARLAGIDHSFVSRLEAGRRTPSFPMAQRLAEILRMTDVERNQLLLAVAGIEDRNVLLDRECIELHRLLNDETLPVESRLHLRDSIRTFVAAWRARG